MHRPRALLVIACLVGLGASAWGMFAPLQPTPVDRLITNISAYIKEHPKDAQGYYTLGRLHYLAFVQKADSIGVWGAGDAKKLPSLPPDGFMGGRRRGDEPAGEPLKPEVLKQHIAESATNFAKAIELDPKSGLAHLGLASMIDQASPLAPDMLYPAPSYEPKEANAELAKPAEPQVKRLGAQDAATRDEAQKALREMGFAAMPVLATNLKADDPEVRNRVGQVITEIWKETAADHYLRAYKLAVTDDLKIRNRPIHGIQSLVSFEAGAGYKRLVEARGATDKEKEQIAQIDKDRQTLANKPMGPITPIVFAMDRAAPLADLVDTTTTVTFDLDGTGRNLAWPWLRPTTGILVWDPEHTGRITSGRQLFGSVTWWIFWENGYRAMDALDDNRDGQLSGSELAGLAVWHDRNGNGRSDAGEVTAIEQTPITALSVRPTGRQGASPACTSGLWLRDGRVLPTYDWVTAPR